jgi:hypothetical protein
VDYLYYYYLVIVGIDLELNLSSLKYVGGLANFCSELQIEAFFIHFIQFILEYSWKRVIFYSLLLVAAIFIHFIQHTPEGNEWGSGLGGFRTKSTNESAPIFAKT